MRLYSFDVDGDALELVPLAARRALDHAGRKLALAGWTSLEHGDRATLVRLGSTSPVDLDAVARVLRRARPAPSNTEPAFDPPRDAPPQRVLDALATGAATARGLAQETMRQVREIVGLDGLALPA